MTTDALDYPLEELTTTCQNCKKTQEALDLALEENNRLRDKLNKEPKGYKKAKEGLKKIKKGIWGRIYGYQTKSVS